MIAEMNDGAVVVDVAIDQGGCFETSHPTTHSDPVYVVDGVIHYCVANMPGGVPITSTKALTNATLPYVEAIAGHGLRAAVAADPALARGVNVLGGRVTYEAVAEAHGLEYTPLADGAGGGLGLGGRRRLGLGAGLRQRADPDDEPGHARRERDHADDEDDEADQTEDVVHEVVG